MNNWDELPFGVGLVLIFFLLVVGLLTLSAHTCTNVGETMGFESKYSALSGCFINVDGRFIPADAYLNVKGVE